MLPEMIEVVGCKEAESHRRIRRDGADRVSSSVGDLREDMRQMPIVGRPQLYEIVPGPFVVVLHLHPMVLNVPRKVPVAWLLRSNETLVIVRRRIDEMAEHLLG